MDKITIALADDQTVSGLFDAPLEPRAMLVLAHGAGVGMRHRSLSGIAEGLFARGVATLRFQFPYMEAGWKRPDRPPVAQATVRAAVEMARTLAPDVPLFAGGRSYGGRMTSMAQAEAPMPGVRGLVLVAFPLHPAGKPADDRAAHLGGVEIPMLFVQGTRDALAEITLLRPVVERLAPRATLHAIEDADHALHLPARAGGNDAEELGKALDAVAAWMGTATGK